MLILLAVVIISILFGEVQLTDSEQFDQLNQSTEQAFLKQLNRGITLEQAISKYPAIPGYFPIEKVSPSESVDANVPIYDVSNVSAHDILSRLNARK